MFRRMHYSSARAVCGGFEEFPLEQTTLINRSYPGKSAPLPSSLNAGISSAQAKYASPQDGLAAGAIRRPLARTILQYDADVAPTS